MCKPSPKGICYIAIYNICLSLGKPEEFKGESSAREFHNKMDIVYTTCYWDCKEILVIREPLFSYGHL